MAMNQQQMRPRRSRQRPANPTITITTQGVTATQGVSNITPTIDDTATDNFGNFATLDSGGMVAAISPASGWSNTFINGQIVTFTKLFPGFTDPPSLASGNGSVDGQPGIDAVAEVAHIDFDGATAGFVSISGATVPWNVTAAELKSALEFALSPRTFASVDGANGVFDATDAPGAQADLSLGPHSLTK